MKHTTRSPYFASALLLLACLVFASSVHAAIIYSNAGPISIVGDGTPESTNLLTGVNVSRDDTSSGSIYLSITVTNPPGPFDSGYFSDGIQLAETNSGGDNQTFFIGKTFYDWTYDCYAPSLYNSTNYNAADIYLNSATPEPGETYQYIRDTDVTTIICRIQYNPGSLANVTIWMNPDLSESEDAQATNLTTTLTNDCTFNEVELYNVNYDGGTASGGAGSGVWVYNNVIIGTAAADVGFPPVVQVAIGRIGNSVTVSWTGSGTLQTAPTTTGPWTDSANQSNPQTMDATNSAEFFRVRQ